MKEQVVLTRSILIPAKSIRLPSDLSGLILLAVTLSRLRGLTAAAPNLWNGL